MNREEVVVRKKIEYLIKVVKDLYTPDELLAIRGGRWFTRARKVSPFQLYPSVYVGPLRLNGEPEGNFLVIFWGDPERVCFERFVIRANELDVVGEDLTCRSV